MTISTGGDRRVRQTELITLYANGFAKVYQRADNSVFSNGDDRTGLAERREASDLRAILQSCWVNLTDESFETLILALRKRAVTDEMVEAAARELRRDEAYDEARGKVGK